MDVLSYCKTGEAFFFVAITLQVFYVSIYVLHCKGNEVVNRWFSTSVRIGILIFIINCWLVGNLMITLAGDLYDIHLYTILTFLSYICTAVFVIGNHGCQCCACCTNNVCCNNFFVVFWIFVSVFLFVRVLISGWLLSVNVPEMLLFWGSSILAVSVQYWLMMEILVGNYSGADVGYLMVDGGGVRNGKERNSGVVVVEEEDP